MNLVNLLLTIGFVCIVPYCARQWVSPRAGGHVGMKTARMGPPRFTNLCPGHCPTGTLGPSSASRRAHTAKNQKAWLWASITYSHTPSMFLEFPQHGYYHVC